MSDLADAVLNSKSRLTYQVSQLAKAGLVYRQACTFDERGVLAALTDDGKEALQRAARAMWRRDAPLDSGRFVQQSAGNST